MKTASSSIARLAYANVFAIDIDALSRFYAKLLGFPEIPDRASPIYRCLDAGGGIELGFNHRQGPRVSASKVENPPWAAANTGMA